MLAFAIRGFVLLSVISWYSNSVWKMIDGYFKDKFDKYLREEYQKYPQMKQDIQSIEKRSEIVEAVEEKIDNKDKLFQGNIENEAVKIDLNLEIKSDGKDNVEKLKKIGKKKWKLKKGNCKDNKVKGENDNGDDDFSEFESDSDKKSIKFKGTRIANLPFKPKADIGSLDIISEDEFCPISLEDYDEQTCRETKIWP